MVLYPAAQTVRVNEFLVASKISDDLLDRVGKLVMGRSDPVLGLDEAGQGSTGQA